VLTINSGKLKLITKSIKKNITTHTHGILLNERILENSDNSYLYINNKYILDYLNCSNITEKINI